ncbi:pH-response regulator protein palH/prr-4 [Paramyrothecium foliicola]|nr:pH-response regulator protein palH/prr-4 [Paramyrothecium foliicola]
MDAGGFITSTTTALATLCTTTILSAGSVITLDNGAGFITLDHPAAFATPCPTLGPRDTNHNLAFANSDQTLSQPDQGSRNSDFRTPFHASTIPIVYALAATTITAYMLVIMLFITPRSFLDGGVVHLSRRSFTNSSSNGISIGGRPWLQKVAALTVAISLTIATVDTFKIVKYQYVWGFQNASDLQREVMGRAELKVIRLISDTFLWLAQAQTLIRLFPRQREKIIIKWAAFALITLDVIFSAINSFKYSDNGINARPTEFVHPIPALSYLFQLTLGVLYAAWVIYYALMKKRYAFYHPLMKNIFLVAVISIISIIVPIVFFIIDISEPQFTGWGDYVRWVGAAAASVVVWEWVERIEALEREEKRDGILGREVFDGDDTLEVNASEFPWFRQPKHRKDDSNNQGGGGGRQHGSHAWTGVPAIAGQSSGRHDGNEVERRRQQRRRQQPSTVPQSANRPLADVLPPLWPTRPAATATPISRTDTASAASTVYAVRYQPTSETTTRTPELPVQQTPIVNQQNSNSRTHLSNDESSSSSSQPAQPGQNGHIILPPLQRPTDPESAPILSAQEQQTASAQSLDVANRPGDMSTHIMHRSRDEMGRWDLRARLEEFAANQADKIREKLRPMPDTQSLPVTVIPAPARNGTALQQVLEEEGTRVAGPSSSASTPSQPGSNGSPQGTGSEMVQSDRSRSVFSGQDPPMPSNNPPLWPGVQRRPTYDDDDAYSYDDDSTISDSMSVHRERRDSEEASRPSAAPPTYEEAFLPATSATEPVRRGPAFPDDNDVDDDDNAVLQKHDDCG